MIPIETVVELLMVNCFLIAGDFSVRYGRRTGEILTSKDNGILRDEVRAYVESHVQVPKKLSECEEDVLVECEFDPERFRMPVKREGDYAVGKHGDVIGLAADFTAIQPVEVNRE